MDHNKFLNKIACNDNSELIELILNDTQFSKYFFEDFSSKELRILYKKFKHNYRCKHITLFELCMNQLKNEKV